MEALGRLAGRIAHDFNNILTAIMGAGAFLQADLAEYPKARDDVEHVLEASLRAAALTRQLLAFSRQQVLQPVATDLNEVVRSISRMLERVIGEDLQLSTTLDPATRRSLPTRDSWSRS